jgi:hypothetical protein
MKGLLKEEAMTNFFTAQELEDRGEMMESALSEHLELKAQLTEAAGDPDEAIKKNYGSWKKVSFKKLRDNALREATNVASTNGQLFRYGIQRVLFDGYKDVPTIYADVCQFISSKNRQEWYAPLYGAEVPTDVPFGGKFPDSRIKGLDVVAVNKKVGRMLTFERELFDYDQTGQIINKASQMGKRTRYKEETDVMTAIKTAAYTALIGNYSGSDDPLTQPVLENADIKLYAMVDPLGNNMLVTPGLLLTGINNKFAAAKMLNSTLQPSIPVSDAGGGSAGYPGWTMTTNPLQGLYSLKVSRFLTAADIFLMEPKTSIVFQEASPVEVVQENPLSGLSFEQDIYRWRVRRLYQVLVLESRYIFAINKS